MNHRIVIGVLWTSALLCGCSTQAWYEGLSRSGEFDCNTRPVGEREDCRTRTRQPSYDTYEKERSREKAP